VQVTIRNVGNAAEVDDFWVDAYIDPDPLPTQVNQIWNLLADQELVWGVTVDLRPGETLTLTVGDAYYAALYSSISWPLPAGTPVYAQVDSAAAGSSYGAVLEEHEMLAWPYNNIAGSYIAGE